MSQLPPADEVLVVDDDLAVRQLVAAALTAEGWRAAVAGDVAEALRALSDRRIGLVILDERMPGASGTDLLRQLRADPALATLPVIMLTASAGEDGLVQALEAGATDYLTKPFSIRELIARVRAHQRGQHAWAEALEREWALRAQVVQTLSKISPSSPAEHTAGLICRGLCRLPAVRAVAVVVRGPHGLPVVIAEAGNPPLAGRLGTPLDAQVVGLLGGEHNAPRLITAPAVSRALFDDEPGAAGMLVVAPLRTAKGTVGQLVLLPANPLAVDRALAVATDFAPVVVELLAASVLADTDLAAARGALSGLVANKQLQPTFQPVVDLRDLSVVGYEALTRFPDQRRPAEVFADARRLDFGDDLEIAAVGAAIAVADGLPSARWLALNLSPHAILASTELAATLARTDRPLVIEVTEHDPIDDYPQLRDALRIVAPGTRLAIDDTGAGYASFRHVLSLHPDFIKLDREWVAGIDADPVRQALLVGLAHFARHAGATLIAEGIETPGELATLRTLDVRLGQGYLLGAPEPLPVR